MEDKKIEELEKNKIQVAVSSIFSLIGGIILILIAYLNFTKTNIENGIFLILILMGIIGIVMVLYGIIIIIREIQIRR